MWLKGGLAFVSSPRFTGLATPLSGVRCCVMAKLSWETCVSASNYCNCLVCAIKLLARRKEGTKAMPVMSSINGAGGQYPGEKARFGECCSASLHLLVLMSKWATCKCKLQRQARETRMQIAWWVGEGGRMHVTTHFPPFSAVIARVHRALFFFFFIFIIFECVSLSWRVVFVGQVEERKLGLAGWLRWRFVIDAPSPSEPFAVCPHLPRPERSVSLTSLAWQSQRTSRKRRTQDRPPSFTLSFLPRCFTVARSTRRLSFTHHSFIHVAPSHALTPRLLYPRSSSWPFNVHPPPSLSLFSLLSHLSLLLHH